MDAILGSIIILSFLGIPFFLTIKNVLLINTHTKKAILYEILTVVLGPIYTLIYIDVSEILNVEWYQQLYNKQLHTPIASESHLSIFFISMLAIGAYLLLRFNKFQELSPLIIVFSISAIYIGIVLCCIWMIQVTDIFLMLFPLNCIILAIKQINKTVLDYRDLHTSIGYISICYNRFSKDYLRLIIYNSYYWPTLAYICVLPLLGIIVCILVLFGQEPDAIIRAWTQTSDWNLSQQVSPENISVDEHYLCTVAARGHKKIVKPLRVGIRHNHKVIVNRQLCIANAFEQLLEENIPKVHKSIRSFYDKYGYAFAKGITSSFVMDVIYIFMKPLEYIFLFIIYLVDTQPENRIAMQYIKEIPKNTN